MPFQAHSRFSFNCFMYSFVLHDIIVWWIYDFGQIFETKFQIIWCFLPHLHKVLWLFTIKIVYRILLMLYAEVDRNSMVKANWKWAKLDDFCKPFKICHPTICCCTVTEQRRVSKTKSKIVPYAKSQNNWQYDERSNSS